MPYKICDKCGLENGVRTKTCSCGRQFPQKTKREKALKPKTEEIEWQELKPKDEVKIISGTGPYFENKNGDRTYLGCPAGKYEVICLEKDGFFVNDGCGRIFVYMAEKRDGIVGIKEAHKVKLIRRAEKII